MRESPPAALIALLERLGLATAAQVRRMRGRVRRLAQDLPEFESVWIDALAQARLLTPFQAAEIHAGRGESLRVGPLLLTQRLPWPEYAGSYRARRVDGSQPVRLLVVESPGERSGPLRSRCEALAALAGSFQCEHLAPVTEAGCEGNRLWAASPWVEGRSAAEWLVHNGRFPSEVVLEIARAMLVGLVALEKAGVSHGDPCAAGLLLTDSGGVVLLQPGIRAILRPEEGYAHADLRPEAYDYLAPERVSEGRPPDTASDIYACGCLWWHLLCGRPPLAGGDSLAKLRAAEAAKISDLRRLAPEVPAPLAAAVSACLRREPGQRPETMARLAAMLGPPTRSGRLALARCLARPGSPADRWSMPARRRGRPLLGRRWPAVAAVCLAVAAVTLGSLWSVRLPLPAAKIANQQVATKASTNLSKAVHQATPVATDLRLVPGESQEVKPSGYFFASKDVVSASNGSGRNRLPAGSTSSAASPRPDSLPTNLRSVPGEGTDNARPVDTARSTTILPDGRPLRLESLELRAGQHVVGRPGKRPLLLVPRAGLVVASDDVCFENVDFVWNHADASRAGEPPGAMLRLRCGRAQFRGCTFQSGQDAGVPPAAIQWTDADDPGDAALSLPCGRLRLTDCVLHPGGVGIDCRRAGALVVELTNTLHVGSGPLVRLDHCPGPDEPLRMMLAKVTLRDAGPLLECAAKRLPPQPGEISIEAAGCAFVPAAGMPLLLVSGPDPPQRLLENMRWTGQGSLVAPQAVIAAWRPPAGPQQTLDDAAASIAGLVRSEVGFAGRSLARPGDSRILRWQAPLQSADPPGINPHTLPVAEVPNLTP